MGGSSPRLTPFLCTFLQKTAVLHGLAARFRAHKRGTSLHLGSEAGGSRAPWAQDDSPKPAPHPQPAPPSYTVTCDPSLPHIEILRRAGPRGRDGRRAAASLTPGRPARPAAGLLGSAPLGGGKAEALIGSGARRCIPHGPRTRSRQPSSPRPARPLRLRLGGGRPPMSGASPPDRP